MTKPGILALQGCIDPHIQMFKNLGVDCLKIKDSNQLKSIDRLILPGGESSTMLKLLKKFEIFNALKQFAANNPVWGICAGAILLAAEVENPVQDSLKVAPIKAYRNFYGSQLNSFKTEIEIFSEQLAVDFIRAPKLEVLSDEVEVIATHENLPVFLKFNRLLISSFHTELSNNHSLHKFFLNL